MDPRDPGAAALRTGTPTPPPYPPRRDAPATSPPVRAPAVSPHGPVRFWPVERRLASAATIWDLRSVARRHVPRSVFDYTDGAAETETSLQRSRDAFKRVEFVPRVLVTSRGRPLDDDPRPTVVDAADLRADRVHPADAPGGRAVGRPGRRPDGHPVRPVDARDDLARGRRRGRARHRPLVPALHLERPRRRRSSSCAGRPGRRVPALMLTVDTPVAGARLRDVHNGFTIPPTLSLRTLVDIGLHPGWWFDKLTTEPLSSRSSPTPEGRSPTSSTASSTRRSRSRTSPGCARSGTARSSSRGSRPSRTPAPWSTPARTGSCISNHGGRQLDRAPTPLEQLPSIKEAVGGRAEVYLDGGVLSGSRRDRGRREQVRQSGH